MFEEINEKEYKQIKQYDFNKLYEHAHSELSLQQSKRDQIITLYIALFTFFIPFVLSLNGVSQIAKGFLFVFLGFIGIMFCFIVIRYRVYKEVYWVCCQTISQLKNYDIECIDKGIVQKVFYNTLKKKGASYIDAKKKRINSLTFFKKNIFSAETLHYMIIMFVTILVISLGIVFIVNFGIIYKILIGVIVSLLVATLLLSSYFNNLEKVYNCIADNKDSSFNFAFSKAWFLHFYN